MITAVEAAINEAMIRKKKKKKQHFTNGKDSNMWKKNLW